MYKNAIGGRAFGGTARFNGGRALVATTPRMAQALKAAALKANRQSKATKRKKRKRVKKNPAKFEIALAAAIGEKAAAAYVRDQKKNQKKSLQP